MTKKFRLLPLSIIIMSMVLGIKIVDFSFGLGASIAEAGEPGQEADASGVDQKKQKGADGAQAGDEAAGSMTENVTPTPLNSIPTRKEIEYLQKLSQRRQELNRRARDLDDREKLLEAVEMRIVERTNSLKKIKATIEGLLKEHSARERAQLESLVKIYSAMKPNDAAQIFNNLDDDVLISIVENMNEKKMGAILAKMNLDKAKKLTINLATSKKLPKIEG